MKIYFSGCDDFSCNPLNHEECKQYNPAQNAQCVCRRGFTARNGVCITRPICFTVRLRFTIPFVDYLLDFFNSLTINFINTLQGRLFVALRLESSDFVIIVLLYRGSTIAEFDILLSSNTTQNATSITNNLVDDIFNNSTESLHAYYPTSAGNVSNLLFDINGNFSYFYLL